MSNTALLLILQSEVIRSRDRSEVAGGEHQSIDRCMDASVIAFINTQAHTWRNKPHSMTPFTPFAFKCDLSIWIRYMDNDI